MMSRVVLVHSVALSTPVSIWRVGDQRLCTDRCRYRPCRLVCVLWDLVGHPWLAMRKPGQGMSTEEEELDLLVGYSTPLSAHSVDGRWYSVYCSVSQL